MLRALRLAGWGAIGIVAFVAVSLAGGWIVTDGPLAPASSEKRAPRIGSSGPFALSTHLGKVVTEQDFRGRPLAIFFGFTFCPEVCPTTLARIGDLMTELGPEATARVHWLFVTVDSERDNQEVLAEYLQAFDQRIVGLRGSEAQVAEAARRFGIVYSRVPLSAGGYTMDHTASILLFDAQGQLVGTIDNKESETVALQKLRLLSQPGRG